MSSLFFLMNLLLLQLLLLLRQRRRELLLRKQAPPSCSCSSHCATPASPWRPLQRHLAVLPSLAPAPAAVLCPGKAPPLGAEKKRLCAAQPGEQKQQHTRAKHLNAVSRVLPCLAILYNIYAYIHKQQAMPHAYAAVNIQNATKRTRPKKMDRVKEVPQQAQSTNPQWTKQISLKNSAASFIAAAAAADGQESPPGLTSAAAGSGRSSSESEAE